MTSLQSDPNGTNPNNVSYIKTPKLQISDFLLYPDPVIVYGAK